MARLATALAATALAPLERLKPWASSVARVVSWERRSTISACWDRISSLAPAGHDTQSASEIPEAGVVITGDLCLRCNRDSSCRQGFSRNDVHYDPSRPLNRYDFIHSPCMPSRIN